MEQAQTLEVSERLKAYKFEMKRISGNLDPRISLKWGPDRGDRDSANLLIFSQKSEEESTTPESNDFADVAILRTLYRRSSY